MRITVAQVNKMLKSKGVKEELVRGKDYFYFIGGDSYLWQGTMVYTTRVNGMSLERWWDEYQSLRSTAFDY
jgi:hypothetical protein